MGNRKLELEVKKLDRRMTKATPEPNPGSTAGAAFYLICDTGSNCVQIVGSFCPAT
ncbi:MAG: hypothetical protein SVM80_02895 [Halobacteriota archaeon]|nr:hypothetical protein [Halobacteriota archaeon]